MPIEPQAVTMKAPGERGTNQLTLGDIELWCQEMRERGAHENTPVFGATAGFRARLTVISATPPEAPR